MEGHPIVIGDRRRSLLSQKDLDAIASQIEDLFEKHKCNFSAEELVIVRDFVRSDFKPDDLQIIKGFIEIYRDTRSTMRKLIIGAIFVGALILVILANSHHLISIEKPMFKIGG